MFAILAIASANEIPDITQRFFIDDQGVRIIVINEKKALKDLRATVTINLDFDDCTGQATNEEKSHGSGTTTQLRRAVARIMPSAKVPKAFVSLGYVVNTTKSPLRALQNLRVDKANDSLDAIACVPRCKEDKAYYIATVPMAQLEYGCDTGWPTMPLLDTMASKVIRTAFSEKRKLASGWLVLSLCFRVHRVDPRARVIWHTLHVARHMLTGNFMRVTQVRNIWSRPGSRIPGPAATLLQAYKFLGWKHQLHTNIKREFDTDVDLCGGSITWWDHEVRRSIRFAWTQRVAERREVQGLHNHHVAWVATTAMMRETLSRNLRQVISELLDDLGGMPSKRIRGTIASIVSASIRDGVVLQRAHARETETCPFCGRAIEDHHHIWQVCSKWAPIRNRFPHWRDFFTDMPIVTQHLAIALELDWVAGQRQELASMDTAIPNQPWEIPGERPWHVFLDGSCDWPEVPEIRRAGIGFWASNTTGPSQQEVRDSDTLTFDAPLPGADQNIALAELYMLLFASAWFDKRVATFYIDNKWVCDCAILLLGDPTIRVDNWTYARCWLTVAANFKANLNNYSAVKVKAHLAEDLVKHDPVLYFRWHGNNMADNAAAIGVSRHSLTRVMIKQWKEQFRRTASQQIMMVAIVDARCEAERARGGNPDYYAGDPPDDFDGHATATPSRCEPLIQEVPTTIEALRHRFPMFPWNRDVENYESFSHPLPPKFDILGSVPRDGRADTRWGYPNELYHALHWYLSTITWLRGARNRVTAFHLAVDFEAASGRRLANNSTGVCLTARAKVSTFIAMVSRVGAMHSVDWLPGAKTNSCDLHILGLQRQAYAWDCWPNFLVPEAFQHVALAYQGIRTTEPSWDWEPPCHANEPLMPAPNASDLGDVPRTWANKLREAAGLEKNFKTAWADKARDEAIDKHNAVNNCKRHQVKLMDLQVPLALVGRDFSAWMRQVDALLCLRCGATTSIKDIDKFLKAACSDVPVGISSLKRRKTLAASQGARTFARSGDAEMTYTNRLRHKAGLVPLAQSAHLDKLREAELQHHREVGDVSKHAIVLDEPDESPKKMEQTQFASWVRTIRVLRCTRCTKKSALRFIENFTSEECCGSAEELSRLAQLQHVNAGKASRAAAASSKAKPPVHGAKHGKGLAAKSKAQPKPKPKAKAAARSQASSSRAPTATKRKSTFTAPSSKRRR